MDSIYYDAVQVFGAGGIQRYDQRGLSRPAYGGNGLRPDIGAYEAQIEPSADFDSDGDVDGRDFLIWQRGFGTANATRAEGNSDDDTDVDASDLAAWQATYGEVRYRQPNYLSTGGEATISAAVAALTTASPVADDPMQTDDARLVITAQLIDAAIVLATRDDGPSESTELPSELAHFETTQANDRALASYFVANGESTESLFARPEETNDTTTDAPWLSDELLEKAFG